VAVRPILLIGEPILRTRAAPVTEFGKPLRALVKEMMRTLHAVPGRAGLAAPQIGEGVRVVVYDNGTGLRGHLVNPVLELSEQGQDGDEGCLSAPGVWAPLRRAYAVTARGSDTAGRPVKVRLTGPMARCLQHELDHLDGVLFLDRLDEAARTAAQREIDARWPPVSP
jgi:peptide deformylase